MSIPNIQIEAIRNLIYIRLHFKKFSAIPHLFIRILIIIDTAVQLLS